MRSSKVAGVLIGGGLALLPACTTSKAACPRINLSPEKLVKCGPVKSSTTMCLLKPDIVTLTGANGSLACQCIVLPDVKDQSVPEE
jgi:hypothetical protein